MHPKPPRINYPPLPRRVGLTPCKSDAHKVGAVSPFAKWSVNKAYLLPNAHDSYPVVTEILCGEFSAQTRSEVGLDEFNYQVHLALLPSKDNLDELIETLRVWAIANPRTLIYHLFHESLDQVLGTHFPWAIFGKAKTLSRGSERRPW